MFVHLWPASCHGSSDEARIGPARQRSPHGRTPNSARNVYSCVAAHRDELPEEDSHGWRRAVVVAAQGADLAFDVLNRFLDFIRVLLTFQFNPG